VTMAQRLVRAKHKLRDNHAPYRIPSEVELPDRLDAVLSAIYLVYSEGHTATYGTTLARADLSKEAIRLGRVLIQLLPEEPEATGLLALMLLTQARQPARVGADGTLVRLAEQDRAQWDGSLIDEGHRLVRACLRWNRPGAFQIQAAIAAVHADASTANDTDWSQVLALYDQLLTVRPNAVVALNRAIAVGELHGPAAGLASLEAVDTTLVTDYQPYHATRADLLLRSGRVDEALAAYDRAIALTTNEAERAFLQGQRRSIDHG
jgi:RNA polymerase sigma-70 factor (ECF subfamily)